MDVWTPQLGSFGKGVPRSSLSGKIELISKINMLSEEHSCYLAPGDGARSSLGPKVSQGPGGNEIDLRLPTPNHRFSLCICDRAAERDYQLRIGRRIRVNNPYWPADFRKAHACREFKGERTKRR